MGRKIVMMLVVVFFQTAPHRRERLIATQRSTHTPTSKPQNRQIKAVACC